MSDTPARDSLIVPYLHTPVYQSRNQYCRCISHYLSGSFVAIGAEGVRDVRAAEHHRSTEPRLTLALQLGKNLLIRSEQKICEGSLARHAELHRRASLRFKGADEWATREIHWV